jgi:hypothetical protein
MFCDISIVEMLPVAMEVVVDPRGVVSLVGCYPPLQRSRRRLDGLSDGAHEVRNDVVTPPLLLRDEEVGGDQAQGAEAEGAGGDMVPKAWGHNAMCWWLSHEGSLLPSWLIPRSRCGAA